MYIITIACLCALATLQQCDASCKLPTFVTRCKRNDPDFEQCWRSIIEEAPHHLADGIPECHIPPIDPWRNQLVVTTSETFYISHINVEISNTKHFEVLSNTISSDLTHITLKLRFPELHRTCTMIGNGTLLNYTIADGVGCNEATQDVTISFVFQGEKISKEGKDYIAFNNVTAVAEGTYTNQIFLNVVGGPSGDETLMYHLQQQPHLINWLYNEVIEKIIAADIVVVIQNVYGNYSLDEIHP